MDAALDAWPIHVEGAHEVVPEVPHHNGEEEEGICPGRWDPKTVDFYVMSNTFWIKKNTKTMICKNSTLSGFYGELAYPLHSPPQGPAGPRCGGSIPQAFNKTA